MKRIIVLLFLPINLAFGQYVTIKGTILCDTEDKGIIPEMGAEIFILELKVWSKDSPESLMRISMMKDLSSITLINTIIESYEMFKHHPELAKDYAEELSKYGIKNSFDDPVYKGFDAKALKEIHYLTENVNTIKTLTDGAGNYSVKVRPGRYSFLVKSKLTKEIFSLTEYDGRINYDFFKIEDGAEKVINHKFVK